MPKYFQNMPQVGKALANIDEANENAVKEIEAAIADSVAAMQDSGTSDEKIHDKGQMTALERVAELVDEGTWYPLNTLYNPENFETGTGIVVVLNLMNKKKFMQTEEEEELHFSVMLNYNNWEYQ